MTMDLDPVFLSRLQFAFVVSFHIIFPAFTIGLAAWLATIEGVRLAIGNPVYRRVFDFWLRIFALSFAMGVVSGIVMAFQFGTNWSVLSERTGPIQGPLLGYEGFTAFLLEATFFGVMLLGRDRVPAWFYFFSCCMVSLGTMFSSFWILCNNSWMQVPIGHAIVDNKIVPDDWWAITTGPIVRIRWPHMLLAALLTTGMSIIATGAWHMLWGRHEAESRVMLNWGLGFVAVIIPIQMVFGHLTGEYVLHYQPEKFAAIEARWQTQQPATEVLLAIPDPWAQRNLFPIQVPRLGSFIASGDWTAKEIGLEAFPPDDRPPVIIPFFAFRIMVGMGLIMVAISWVGVVLMARTIGERALVLVGRVPVVSDRLYRRALRLVHGRGRASALGRLPHPAHRGRDHAVADRRRGFVLAARLHRGLRGDLCVRADLHLSPAAKRTSR
jgi:cytochrome d ubiquinol oxidase subunit I